MGVSQDSSNRVLSPREPPFSKKFPERGKKIHSSRSGARGRRPPKRGSEARGVNLPQKPPSPLAREEGFHFGPIRGEGKGKSDEASRFIQKQKMVISIWGKRKKNNASPSKESKKGAPSDNRGRKQGEGLRPQRKWGTGPVVSIGTKAWEKKWKKSWIKNNKTLGQATV